MPRITGFPIGSQARGSLLSGNISRAFDIPAFGQPGGASIWDGPPGDQTLTVNVAAFQMADAYMFAPFAIEFDITVSGSAVGERPVDPAAYDPTFLGIDYVLVTGDSSVGRNAKVGSPAHRLRAFRTGQQPRHVYGTSANYTYQVYAYDRFGKWGKSDPFTFFLPPPESKFIPSRTIVISNDVGEDWSGAPPHDPANRCTTLAQAKTRKQALQAATGQGGIRFSFKNGITIGSTFGTERGPLTQDVADGRILFDTWNPTGAKATVSFAPNMSTGNNGGAPPTFNNLILEYGWDRMRDCLKDDSNAQVNFLTENYYPNNWLVDHHHTVINNCDVLNTREAIYYPVGNKARDGIYINDTLLKDHGDYLSFGPRSFALLNSSVEVSYGAALGLMGRHRMGGSHDHFGQAHNAIRNPRRGIYWDGSFVEGKGGWSGQNNGNTLWDQQALFRGESFGSIPSQRNHLSRSVIMGSLNVSSVADSGSGLNQTVAEACIFAHDAQMRAGKTITEVGPGDSFRNCAFMFAGNVRGLQSDYKMSKFEAGFVDDFAGFLNMSTVGADREGEILHYTLIGYQNAAGNPSAAPVLRLGTVGHTNVEGHGVVYLPDHEVVPSGGVSFIDQPWTWADIWMRVAWERQTFTLAADVADTETTALISYPTDFNLNPTVQADYSGTLNRHSVRVGPSGSTYHQISGGISSAANKCTFNLGADGFTITNRSGVTWPSGTVLWIMLDRGRTLEDPTLIYAIPAGRERLIRPTTPQPLTEGVRSTLFDFNMDLRPDAGRAISPTAAAAGRSNAAGAILPA